MLQRTIDKMMMTEKIVQIILCVFFILIVKWEDGR